MRFTPKSRESWRRWLEKHHDSKAHVWLVFYKLHTGKPTLSYDDAVEEAICFGWIDGVKRSVDVERYTQRFSPRTADSHWSALNRKRAERMKAAGLMRQAGESAIRKAKRNGRWAAADQPIDSSLPPELARELRGNGKAAAFFESLAPSYRRQFVAWINAAKRPETRRRRLAESIALLARGEKLGMR